MLRTRGTSDQGVDKQRELLFGRRPAQASAVAEDFESENHGAVENLRGQVNDMRHLALNIGDEVQEQNRYLDGMSGTFDNAGEALSSTLRALRRLPSLMGGHLIAMFIFSFFVFLLIYLLLRK